MADLHPGSFVGDTVEEFKKLPTWGKIAVGLAVGLVVFLAIRARQQAASTAASTAATDTTGAASSAFPMVNGLPVLPSNVSPIYDSSGNVIGYQQAPTPSTTTTDISGASSNPPSPIPSPTGQPPAASNPPSTDVTLINSHPPIIAGYPPSLPTATGSPPRQPTPHPATPKLSHYTVVAGDSLSGIAARLHYQGGWQALYNDNQGLIGPNPNLIRPGQVLELYPGGYNANPSNFSGGSGSPPPAAPGRGLSMKK